MALPIEQDEKTKKKISNMIGILESIAWATTPQGDDYWFGVIQQLVVARDFKLGEAEEDEPDFASVFAAPRPARAFRVTTAGTGRAGRRNSTFAEFAAPQVRGNIAEQMRRYIIMDDVQAAPVLTAAEADTWTP